jgi:pimeloyl-ACP methyl ester carboxylesterase
MLEILLRHGGGHRMVPVTIKYMTERRLRAERWTSGLVDWPGPLSIIWGDADPVSVPAVADRLLQLRPKTIAVRLANVGHWPQLEAPALVASELQRLLDPRKKEAKKRRAG